MARPVSAIAPTPASEHSIAEIEAAFHANYGRFQYGFIDLMAEHLADTSRAFKGDLQSAVLLAILCRVTLQALIEAGAPLRAIRDIPSERRGISRSRLVVATGIPQETVRRKLLAMERRGWLRREANFWVLAFVDEDAVARSDLLAVDNHSINRAARFFAAVMPLVTAGSQEK